MRLTHRRAVSSDDAPTTNQKYVRQGASGTGSGNDWANAYTNLPSSLVRDTTYWIADGSYGNQTLDDANNGSQVIRIKKATVALHGSATDWFDIYGDGQATFGSVILGSDYWTLDGSTRNESDWDDGNAYGFRITGIEASTSLTPGVCSAHFKGKYINVGGAEGTSYTGSEPEFCFKVAGFAEHALDWIIQRCYCHNIAHAAQFHLTGLNGGLVEYCWISNGWGKEAIRGQTTCKNLITRFNWFWNASMNSGVPLEGSTAEIAIWGADQGAGSFDNNEIYGNVFFRNNSEENSGGTIVVGGDGTESGTINGWAGVVANNTKVYHNTITGVEGGGSGGNILLNGGSGNEARNNLWWDTITAGVSPNTSNNLDAGADPFVNYAGGNLHLSANTASGAVLDSPYNVDMDGVVRTTRTIGAFEYV